MSLRDQILNKQDIPSEIVKIKEWETEVKVQGMTGAERTRILDLAMQEGDGTMNLQMVYPEIVISTAFDPETGEQIFTPTDRAALLSKSAVALDRLATVGMRLSGFTQDTADALGKDSSETVIEDSSLN